LLDLNEVPQEQYWKNDGYVGHAATFDGAAPDAPPPPLPASNSMNFSRQSSQLSINTDIISRPVPQQVRQRNHAQPHHRYQGPYGLPPPTKAPLRARASHSPSVYSSDASPHSGFSDMSGSMSAQLTGSDNFEYGPGWTTSVAHAHMYTADQREYQAIVAARVDRGFFLVDTDWVCYRRNYFQVSASFIISETTTRTPPPPEKLFIYTAPETPIEIAGFCVQLTAEVYGSDRAIVVTQHATKRDKTLKHTDMVRRAIRPGGDITFATVTSDLNTTFERLQFKTATLNNGKRRAQQQYYALKAELIAMLDTGDEVVMAEAKSSPLIVRGRGPGHYVQQDNGMTDTPELSNPPHTASVNSAPTWSNTEPPSQILSAPLLTNDQTPFAWDTPAVGHGQHDLNAGIFEGFLHGQSDSTDNLIGIPEPMIGFELSSPKDSYLPHSAMWSHQADHGQFSAPLDTLQELSPTSPVTRMIRMFGDDETWNPKITKTK